MKKRVTYRPGKASGIMSGVVGAIMVLIGVFMVIPAFGLFGLLWTGIALAITIGNLYHAFGKNYMGPEINIEDESMPDHQTEEDFSVEHHTIPSNQLDAEGRLEQIKRLKEAGLLTDEEYRAKRDEIIGKL